MILIPASFAHVVTVTDRSLSLHQMTETEVLELSKKQHQENKYCGGFVASTKGESFIHAAPKSFNFIDYTIDRSDLVQPYIKQVNEARILANIGWFSSYYSRYYNLPSGVKAMVDLSEKWGSLVKHLDYAKVELYQHKDWPQPSVILTLKGQRDDLIIVGGHGDSINNDFYPDTTVAAPGADDNASGIAVITEVIQILGDNSYRPTNTIQFIAYAAEEVGLMGSMEISAKYQEENKNVRGVIQFDGTNFHGSKDLSMTLIRDNTDLKQNRFLGKLIDTYLKTKWGWDECGYACTDSFSWNFRGFTASFPAESRVKEENPHIHTSKDTLDASKNSATHAVNFSKLGLAYVVELDK